MNRVQEVDANVSTGNNGSANLAPVKKGDFVWRPVEIHCFSKSTNDAPTATFVDLELEETDRGNYLSRIDCRNESGEWLPIGQYEVTSHHGNKHTRINRGFVMFVDRPLCPEWSGILITHVTEKVAFGTPVKLMTEAEYLDMRIGLYLLYAEKASMSEGHEEAGQLLADTLERCKKLLFDASNAARERHRLTKQPKS